MSSPTPFHPWRLGLSVGLLLGAAAALLEALAPATPPDPEVRPEAGMKAPASPLGGNPVARATEGPL